MPRFDTGETEDRVAVARRFEQRHGLAPLADLAAHVVAELHADLDVASLVPALPSHVELHRKRGLFRGVVECRSTRTLQCLDLADEDAVHLASGSIAHLRRLGIEQPVLADIVRTFVGEALLGGHAVEATVALQRIGWQLLAHGEIVDESVSRESRRVRGDRARHDCGRACRLHTRTVLASSAGWDRSGGDASRRGDGRRTARDVDRGSPGGMPMCPASHGRRPSRSPTCLSVAHCCTTSGCVATGRRSSAPPARSKWPM